MKTENIIILIVGFAAPITSHLIIGIIDRKKSDKDKSAYAYQSSRENRYNFLSTRPWVVFAVSALSIAYVLSELLTPGEPTKMRVYKIVMGVGLFFFILLQSSIYKIGEVMFRMKTADLNLLKELLRNPDKDK